MLPVKSGIAGRVSELNIVTHAPDGDNADIRATCYIHTQTQRQQHNKDTFQHKDLSKVNVCSHNFRIC